MISELRICQRCGECATQDSMIPMMVPDDESGLGMRSLWFCSKACMADWLDDDQGAE